jgi:hypothetical protein
LRNKIYAFCTEPDISPGSPEESTHDTPRSQFLALTQTCKQLKSEFRPVYMRTGVGFVPIELLPRYLAAFDPLVNTGYDNIIITVPHQMDHAVRISPHLHTGGHVPNVRWVYSKYPDFLGGPLDKRRGELLSRLIFSTAFGPDVDKVELFLRLVPPHGSLCACDKEIDGKLEITFKKCDKQKWMDRVFRRVPDYMRHVKEDGAGLYPELVAVLEDIVRNNGLWNFNAKFSMRDLRARG